MTTAGINNSRHTKQGYAAASLLPYSASAVSSSPFLFKLSATPAPNTTDQV